MYFYIILHIAIMYTIFNQIYTNQTQYHTRFNCLYIYISISISILIMLQIFRFQVHILMKMICNLNQCALSQIIWYTHIQSKHINNVKRTILKRMQAVPIIYIYTTTLLYLRCAIHDTICLIANVDVVYVCISWPAIWHVYIIPCKY